MIINDLKSLSSKTLILASSSPRRHEILQILGIKFDVVSSLFEENLNHQNFTSPSDFVVATARGKVEEVLGRLTANGKSADLIIGADTCVTLEGEVFGKPKKRGTAINMLTKLSGRSHDVLTGVCLKVKTRRDNCDIWQTVEFYEKTIVTFAELNLSLIEAYVDTGEPLDKAGGYGIQGLGGTLIESINGDYYNVMGFPLHKFCAKLLPISTEWKKKL